MRTYMLVFCFWFLASCKPSKETTPDPAIPYMHQLKELELATGRMMTIDDNHDTGFRYYAWVDYEFAPQPPTGIPWELGAISYGGVELPRYLDYMWHNWPDSVTVVPEYGTWHIGGNEYFNAEDHADNMPWPVLDSLPDTIHAGTPFLLSVQNCEFVVENIYTASGPATLPIVHGTGRIDTIEFINPENYDGDLLRFEVEAYVRIGSLPEIVKYVRWNKWVRMVYP